MLTLLVCLVFAVLSTVQTQSFKPAALPLAARSPYLLNFVPVNPSIKYSREFPIGYNTQNQGWVGLIRVDGTAYAWAGDIGAITPSVLDPLPTGPQQTLTPTSTVFTYQTGPVRVTATYLSPIEPGDLLKQSIPASYVSLDVYTTDSAPHSIQVYTDITAEWASGDRGQNVTWFTTTVNSSLIYHSVSTLNQAPYREINAQSAWGQIYYAAPKTSSTTHRTGDFGYNRYQFVQNGTLDNTQDTRFRGITDSFPVFSFAQDLGNITRTTSPLVWAVANIRDSESTGALTYTDLSGLTQTRSLYYRRQYTDDSLLLNDFLFDFPAALNRSRALDARITKAATDVGGLGYADLLALATRQAYCGIEITIGREADGNVNSSDVMAFYKDTGIQDNGNGNAQVSPVHGLLSVFPTFLYLDPALCGALLEPLLRFQSSANYTNGYAALDMGFQYPVATANIDPHSQSVETSAGMIIMVYGHARMTGDLNIITRYYTLLERWADFLTSNALNVTDQTSADGVTVSGQTNLALKGIIAIQAMSNISHALNDSRMGETYSSQAKALYFQWSMKALALDGHLRFSYEDTDSSFSLGYNMFWDLLLGTGLINTSTIDAQTKYISTLVQTFGAPTDSTNTSMVSVNWNMLAAAIAARDNNTQTTLIAATHKWANIPSTGTTPIGQFPLIHDAEDATVLTGRSNPRQGAVYAPLFINMTTFTSGSTSGSSASAGNPGEGVKAGGTNARTPVGGIVGASLGGVAGICLLVGLLLLVRRRRLASTHAEAVQISALPMLGATLPQVMSGYHPSNVTPFTVEDATWHPVSSSVNDSDASSEHASPELDAGTKRALRLRRLLGEARLQQSAMVTASVQTRSRSRPSDVPALPSVSQPTDPVSSEGILREISGLRMELRMEIAALRMSGGLSAPPEYNA